MKAILFVLLNGLILTFSFGQKNDCPPVQRLKQLYESDSNFRSLVNVTLENVQELDGHQPNPWKNKTINDLYSFINDWYYFLPSTSDGLDKIIEFSFLYYHNPAGQKLVTTEPGLSWTKYFVEERGKFMDSRASVKNIDKWLGDKSLNNEEYVLPKEGFQSFNEFFTRDLKPGMRPVSAVDDNSIVVSPADGIINMINNNLQWDTNVPTKGAMALSLDELLDHSSLAEKFIGGTALACFLMPTNYHHYHAPVTGTVVESRQDVGSNYFGIPDIPDLINNGNLGYNKDFSVFENFRRGYLIFKTESFGYVAMIPVGLQTIGSVVFEDRFKMVTPDKCVDVTKGEKIGHFAYGGSLVILLFERGRFGAVSVNQGQQIGKFH